MRTFLVVFLFSFFSLPSLAATPTPEQIAQFKSLSPGQQAAIAASQGVSLPGAGGVQEMPQPMVDTVQRVKLDPIDTVKKEVLRDQTAEVRAVQQTDFGGQSRYLKEPARQKMKLPVFGASLFAGNPTTFAPVNDIPIPTDYILGPGDQLKIQLFGNKSAEYQLVIDRNGSVALPEIGPVSLAGLSFSDAVSVLKKEIDKLGIGVSSSVTLGQLRSFRVFVMGESRNPGSYLVSGMATLTHALYVSGGISDIGSFRDIQLKRQGKLIASLDLYDLLISGNSKQDVRLQPGDTVFIPVRSRSVSISGEVKRPAIYELKSEKKVADLIDLAGGLTHEAMKQKAKLTRLNKDGFSVISDLNLTLKKDLNITLKDGDAISVSQGNQTFERYVSLSGQVYRDGLFAWSPKMTVLDLLPNIKAFKRQADLNYVLILRQMAPGEPMTVQTFSWQAIASGQASDLPLNSNDQVIVLSQQAGEARRSALNEVVSILREQSSLGEPPAIVTIKGGVKFAGTYPLQENTHLASFIESIGGLRLNVDRDYGLIKRKRPETGEAYFEQFKLDQAKRLVLQPEDLVLLFDHDKNDRSGIIEAELGDLYSQSRKGEPPLVAGVTGVVKFPGKFPINDRGRVADILLAAGGLTEKTLSTEAELFRYRIENGEKRVSDRLMFNPQLALQNNEQHNLLLQPYDEINLKPIAQWNETSVSVTVKGEVRYPGVYRINPGDTMQDLLKRVGGFTEWAEPKNVVFTRENLKQREAMEMQQMANDLEKNLLMGLKADAGLIKGDSQSILALGQSLISRLKSTPALGRLVVTLDRNDPVGYASTLNMELREGDVLYVPKRSYEVLVTGEVARAASLVYQPNMSVSEYLGRSGGATKRADNDSIYIVHGDGSVERFADGWFDSALSTTVLPGDTIVVPLDIERMNPLVSWTSISSILANFALTAATLNAIGVFN
ncbi:hypothetical protein CYQ88_00930 [Hydrogenovibrio sp. SC-1]|uniref:SLBB domain-containing protein n=1 Tax=Hydrogenovibrio sp. SC-1 TaxID=2065820 RepID=UPI000C7DDC6D|nr:SLBB domain-containing protein [Hydrogenovibrio sp. SC-1]PLA75561.1 hypothetical protein CYQ88_00930 [Hydrogenovibrio sp. SC-1]